jgi:hypothetical protein
MPALKTNENVLVQEKVTFENGRGFRVPSGTKGELILTNLRLLFEYTKGLIGKSTFLGIDQPLRTINNVTAEGTVFKKLVVEFSPSAQQAIIGNPRIVLSVSNTGNWIQTMNNAIQNSPPV